MVDPREAEEHLHPWELQSDSGREEDEIREKKEEEGGAGKEKQQKSDAKGSEGQSTERPLKGKETLIIVLLLCLWRKPKLAHLLYRVTSPPPVLWLGFEMSPN